MNATNGNQTTDHVPPSEEWLREFRAILAAMSHEQLEWYLERGKEILAETTPTMPLGDSKSD